MNEPPAVCPWCRREDCPSNAEFYIERTPHCYQAEIDNLQSDLAAANGKLEAIEKEIHAVKDRPRSYPSEYPPHPSPTTTRRDEMKQTKCRLCGANFVCDNGMWSTTCDCARLRPDELADAPKQYASYLTVPETYRLRVACQPLAAWGYGTFHVGSSLERPDYHDVDLRCMLPDEEFDRMFPDGAEDQKLLFLNVAVSSWIATLTGLPIDFQFQRATDANAKYQGRRNGVWFK